MEKAIIEFTENLSNDTAIDKTFLWRASSGKMYSLNQMDTNHLINVICMIWNNSVPKEYRFSNKHLYRFNSFYTPKYMGQAVRCMTYEILQRPDWWQFLNKLQFIQDKLTKLRKES